MRATLLAHSLRIQPGIPATLDIEVTNTSDVIDGISAEVYGLDPAWVPLVQPVVTLFPDTSGTLTIRFNLPTSCAAGESMITVRVFSTLDPRRNEEHPVWITVEPVEAATLELRPSLVEAGTHAEMRAVILNTGNVATEFSVGALEPTRTLECLVMPATVVVQPGGHGEVTVYADGPRPFIGQTLSRNIEVTANSANLELTQTARFMQKARIPRGVITALILAAIVVLWATIFLLVVSYMRARAAPAKSVPATWVAGTREVKITDVAATLKGTVKAASTSKGLARISVEAWRKTKGSYAPAASATTGDDGTFTLAALLPGTYKVKFSADGFDTVWYGGADLSGATAVPLAPRQSASAIDATISGRAGEIIGQVAAVQGKSAAAATVTVTLVPANSSEEVPKPTVVTTDGPFTVPGLETPATYEVRVERPGFDPQVTRVELNGGQSGVLNTSSLVAADGSISGRVVDGAGNGLGNVKVVLRSGSIEKTIVTPTVGTVGEYILDGLPTPRTYVITYTLDGFTSTTVALDLAGGEPKKDVNAVLIGGAGTVVGTARDVDGNPLGGVKVVVAKGSLTAETATLTTGSGTGGTGTYSVAGLPVPGVYTVTFALDGFQSETRQVTFVAATSTPPVVDVVLRRATSLLQGTISVTGGNQPNLNVGLTVELSDGTTVRTAVTTSTPAGFYSFADVPDGTYTLRVFGAGIKQHVVSLTTTQGVDVTRDITVAAS